MSKTKLAIISVIILGLAGASYGGWIFYGHYASDKDYKNGTAELNKETDIDITKLDNAPEAFKKIGNVSKGRYDFGKQADVKRAQEDFKKADAIQAAMPKI